MFIKFKKQDTSDIYIAKHKISSIQPINSEVVQLRYDGKEETLCHCPTVKGLIGDYENEDEVEHLQELLEEAQDQIAELEAEIEKGERKDQLIVLFKDFIDNMENPSKWDDEGFFGRHLLQDIKWKLKELE